MTHAPLPWEDDVDRTPGPDSVPLPFVDRRPYVEDDPDPISAALRSAEIDRSELDGLDRDDPRRRDLISSIDRWEDQARRLAQHSEKILDRSLVDRLFVDGFLDQYGEASAALAATTRDLRTDVLDVVRRRSVTRRQDRIRRLDGEAPSTPGDLRREVVGATNDASVLEAVAGVFAAGAVEAKAIAGELLDELPPYRGKPRASIKVGDGQGMELTVKREARRDLEVNVDEIVDVLVAWQVSGYETETSTGTATTYAAGVRDGIAILRGVLSTTPTFRSSALDAVALSLENDGEDDLARRLRKAYGRVEKGEPRVVVDRKPLAGEEGTS